MNERFDALIVDYGGVLTTPMQDAMVLFAAELGIELQDLVRAALGAYSGSDDPLVTDFEMGKLSEEEFSSAFAQRLAEISGTPVETTGLVSRMFRLDPEESMFEAIGAARTSGFKTGLLSNSWGTALYPYERLQGLFDEIVISGEVGLRKPDPAIFRLIVERLGVPGERCVFVDDHPGHLAAAVEQQMTPVLHTAPVATIAALESLLEVSLS